MFMVVVNDEVTEDGIFVDESRAVDRYEKKKEEYPHATVLFAEVKGCTDCLKYKTVESKESRIGIILD